MSRPSLNAVRFFAVAAKHLSFAAAAQELCVTPGAVSQQIRQLEEELGVALFVRLTRKVRLTERGSEFFQAIDGPLQEIEWAAQKIRPQVNRVDISVLPSFATCWLMSRLHVFTQQYPDIQVRVAATMERANFSTDRIDLGVRLVEHLAPELNSVLLTPERLFPVCSPQYLAQFQGKMNWSKAVLLHENVNTELEHSSTEHWDMWLKQHHNKTSKRNPSLYFSYGMLTIAAALNNQGVALVMPQYVERELRLGALIVCEPNMLQTKKSMYLVWPKHKQQLDPTTLVFKEWLVKEFAQSNLYDRQELITT
jgi:LysR family transcriptional regulator, glycine cleavage system transcriptional activator